MNEFVGTASPLSAQGIDSCARTLSVKPVDLWTVLRVETRGCGYFADRRPAILFERHVFSRRTKGRFDEQAPDISNQQVGGYAGGPAEYDRLERAIALDEEAALASASWGLGQVMGFNSADLGYGSAGELVTRMMISEDEQLAAMAAFIHKNGLDKALREHDWAAFARGYNGPNYAKNHYVENLATAYQHLSTRPLPDLSVREGQLRLTYLGFEPGPVDGSMGSRTKAAMNAFQSKHGLATTATFDAATLEALAREHASLPTSNTTASPPPAPPPEQSAPPEQPPSRVDPATPAPSYALATRPSTPAASASSLVPLSLTPTPALVSAQPAPLDVPPVEDVPLSSSLSEQVRQRLAQPLDEAVQDELARLLVLREKAAPLLGAKAVQSIDLGLTALMAEKPNVAFVRHIRKRVSSAVMDELYPLRPLVLLRSNSPATQVVVGLGLMLLAAQTLTGLVHRLWTTDATTLFGLPARLLLLVALCGAFGSAVSILTRLGDFERQRASRMSMMMMGFFRPIIGMFSAVFCFALMKSGLLPLQAPNPEATTYLYVAVCFLIGFSERLAQDVFARAEDSLVAMTAKPGTQPAAHA